MVRFRPITRAAAKDWINEHHRHSPAPVGDVFRLAVEEDGEIIAVAVAGRPVSRVLDDGETIEITRLAVAEGHASKQLCSQLYGRLCRAAAALGYCKAVTYTLESESGSSPKAAGFTQAAVLRAKPTWSTPARSRADQKRRHVEHRIRWERAL